MMFTAAHSNIYLLPDIIYISSVVESTSQASYLPSNRRYNQKTHHLRDTLPSLTNCSSSSWRRSRLSSNLPWSFPRHLNYGPLLQSRFPRRRTESRILIRRWNGDSTSIHLTENSYKNSITRAAKISHTQRLPEG